MRAGHGAGVGFFAAKLPSRCGLCQHPGMQVTDETIRRTIEKLLERRQPSATICPSEAARDLDPQGWRPLMPQVRAVAVDMAKEGVLTISQAGNTVELDRPLKGPIRLGRPHGEG